jgi:hypothetical protein
MKLKKDDFRRGKKPTALRGNRTPGGSMATTQVTTTPLMLVKMPLL